MLPNKVIMVGILHSIFGIIFPGVFLMFIKKRKNEYRKNLALSWMFISWALFFLFMVIFIFFDLVSLGGLAGIMAVVFGVIPNTGLAFVFLGLAIIFVRKVCRENQRKNDYLIHSEDSNNS